jgi:cation transport protein ChaC
MSERIGDVELVETGDIWIFAYGSLMWDPGFEAAETRPAQLHGYHRAFCVTSMEYRGTPERPGLVLGLVRGGSCRGVAYRVAKALRREVVVYLRQREIPEGIYRWRRVPVATPGGRIYAYSFAVDPGHELYTGRLPFDEVARRIVDSEGARGPNRAYLANTVRHLDELGLVDTTIHALHDAVERLAKSAANR